jgi:hypothetical protein
LLGDDGLLEIKTHNPALMVEVMTTGGCPAKHLAQIQGGLWLTGRSWCDLVCYHPDMPLYIHRVEPDPDYISTLADEVARFAAELAEVVERVQAGR